MKRLQELSKEISDLTFKIEREYPELYSYLDENPITIAHSDHPEVTTKNFADYLESLKDILAHYIETHPHHAK